MQGGIVPIRDPFWGIPHWAQLFLYAISIATIAVFAISFSRRVTIWRMGTKEDRLSHIAMRFALLAKHGVVQARTLTQRYPGIMHVLLFWGFCVLFVGTILAAIDYDVAMPLGFKLLKGFFYLWYKLALDLFGAFLLAGLSLALIRRHMIRPPRLGSTPNTTLAIALLVGITATGFIIEACRLAVVRPSWEYWSPIGFMLARALLALGLSLSAVMEIHLATWLFHFIIASLFVAILPQSYFVHLVTTPLNIFFSKLEPRGALPAIPNLENAESLGISKMEHFSWKRRLDFDACTQCGRCEAVCPAHLSGTVLSPKRLILKLRKLMYDKSGVSVHGSGENQVNPEELWACTTCMACVDACPAFIDIVDTVVDLRRHLTMTEGSIEPAAAASLQNIERAGNPWELAQIDRLAWAEGLDVPRADSKFPVEYLYWVGCAASYDRRNQAIARAVVKILKAADVSFGVMAEERCHGEVARRLGDEYLYQTLAVDTVERLKKYNFQKILTACPHCFNTLGNESTQFGGDFDVVHHSELIAQLLKDNRLRLTRSCDELLTYHDSCYVGRYNGVFDEPREAMQSIPGTQFVEMKRRRNTSLCCGGGGGHMWMEIDGKEPINEIRIDDILETNATTVGTSCPYCMTMLDLGRKVKGAEDRLQVKDIAELVADALES